MSTEEIVNIGFQLISAGVIGWLGYFIKKSIGKNEEINKEQDSRIKAVEKEVNDLKADLPFIYVTREDYIRGMNNIETKLDKIYDQLMKGSVNNG